MTYRKQRQRRTKRVLAVFVIAIIAIIVVLGSLLLQAKAQEQAAVSLRESVLNAAKQCCAVEGSYPSSLEYLEENYGLAINHDNYVVSYEWFADNVLPSVVVTAR